MHGSLLREVDLYLLHLHTRADLLPASHAFYLKCCRIWLAYCAAHGIDYLRATAIDLVAWLRGSGLKPSTIRSYTIGVKQFYAYLFGAGRIAEDPAKAIRTPRRRQAPVEPFANDDRGAILRACETPLDAAIVMLLYGSGLRRTELWGIRARDIDWQAGTIRVVGKGQKVRKVPVNNGTLTVIRLALGQRQRLIPYSADWLYRRFRLICERAEIDGRKNLHRMRHTFGVDFCEAGGRAEDLQILLGHSTLEQTLWYARAGREARALKAWREIDLASKMLA